MCSSVVYGRCIPVSLKPQSLGAPWGTYTQCDESSLCIQWATVVVLCVWLDGWMDG